MLLKARQDSIALCQPVYALGGCPWGNFLLRMKSCFTLISLLMLFAVRSAGAQAVDGFHWVDQPDQTTTTATVTKALGEKKFSALREIGIVGDSALVLTTLRASPTGLPDEDLFTVYAISIKDGEIEELLSGYRLRFRDWLRMSREGQPELVATYDDCVQCQSTSFFTTFYIDGKTKRWKVRWPRNVSGAPLFAGGATSVGNADHVYALMMRDDGRVTLATWSHFERTNAGGEAQREDYLFEYMVDPLSGQGQSNPLSGRDAAEMKQKLCRPAEVLLGMAGGQDSLSCQQALTPAKRPGKKSGGTSRHRTPRYIPPSKMVGRSVPPKQ